MAVKTENDIIKVQLMLSFRLIKHGSTLAKCMTLAMATALVTSLKQKHAIRIPQTNAFDILLCILVACVYYKL